MNPKQPKAYTCCAIDAFTDQFHEVTPATFKTVSEGKHDQMALGNLCGVIKRSSRQAILFAPQAEIPSIADQKSPLWIQFQMWVKHILSGDKGPITCNLYPLPIHPSFMGMLQEAEQTPNDPQEQFEQPPTQEPTDEVKIRMMEQYIKFLKMMTDKMKNKDKGDQPPPGYGELGFDDFRGPNGDDGWPNPNT